MSHILMHHRFKDFIDAGRRLSEVWEESDVKQYPAGVPSFDALIEQFSIMMEEIEPIPPTTLSPL